MKKNTPWVTGERATPTGSCAGDVKSVVLTIVIAEGATLAATDVIGLGLLPAFHTIVGASLIGDALGAGVTANVGFVTGTEGAEVVGTELFAGADLSIATARQLTQHSALLLPAADTDQELGLTVSTDVAAAEQLSLSLVLFYAAAGN